VDVVRVRLGHRAERRLGVARGVRASEERVRAREPGDVLDRDVGAGDG
jgi:hypothetical protein